jgi:hypothetical protein
MHSGCLSNGERSSEGDTLALLLVAWLLVELSVACTAAAAASNDSRIQPRFTLV